MIRNTVPGRCRAKRTTLQRCFSLYSAVPGVLAASEVSAWGPPSSSFQVWASSRACRLACGVAPLTNASHTGTVLEKSPWHSHSNAASATEAALFSQRCLGNSCKARGNSAMDTVCAHCLIVRGCSAAPTNQSMRGDAQSPFKSIRKVRALRACGGFSPKHSSRRRSRRTVRGSSGGGGGPRQTITCSASTRANACRNSFGAPPGRIANATATSPVMIPDTGW